MTRSIRNSFQALATLVVLLLAPLAGAAAASAPAGVSDYPLGAGDLVKISVFDHPELATELRVSEAGTISFPLLGEIKAEGISVHEFEKTLARALTDGGF